LYRDIGTILEQNHPNEAAVMFEKAELHDRAAAVYIRSKNWAKV
jgi:hypothetical protein